MSNAVEKTSCVLMGDEALLVQCGVSLLERGHAIVAVITASKAVADWAVSEGLIVKASDTILSGAVQDATFDWFFSIANLRLVPEQVWRRARSGAVNFHDGPLPRYAGLNAPAWALLAGETEHGATWHLIANRVDGGDILVQVPIAIEPSDTALTLNTKCFEAGISGFSELLGCIERGELQPRPQTFLQRTYFAKHRRPQAGATIDFGAPAVGTDRLLRALDFGHGYANPLGLAKLSTNSGAFNLFAANVITGSPGVPAGTVIKSASDEAHVALVDGILVVNSLTDATGSKLAPNRVLTVGEVLQPIDQAAAEGLSELAHQLAVSENAIARRLRVFKDVVLAGTRPPETGAVPGIDTLTLSVPTEIVGNRGVACAVAYLLRMAGHGPIHLAWADDKLTADARTWRGYLASWVPLSLTFSPEVNVETVEHAVGEELAKLRTWRGFSGDLLSRLAGVGPIAPSVGILSTENPAAAELIVGTAVTIVIPAISGMPRIIFDRRRLPAGEAAALARRLQVFMEAFVRSPSTRVAELALMTEDDFKATVVDANLTQRDYDKGALVHTLISAQARRTPDLVAVACDGKQLTYAELDQRAEHVAGALRTRGAQPDGLVGLYIPRSLELVIAVLGVLKAGSAYVPLDPTYPADRLALMITDSGCQILLTTDELLAQVPNKPPQTVSIEAALRETTAPAVNSSQQSPNTLAYVIYTSGSTGRPKGVMVEHRNVVNFFAGMDDRIPVAADQQPVWLAVTSLSFDISVLELLWTLTRGFKVVVHTANPAAEVAKASSKRVSNAHGVDFGLFYWGNDDGVGSAKYKLLLDGARFADTHGFTAVWTPERHFHAFGGPYPNPAVTGAAVAAVTKNLDIRAGSCVLPLHHVARVAEEWAIVDNLSNGRTGIAVAAGWMPEDFLLRPENAPPHNKSAMFTELATLRRLWRGEAVSFQVPGGKSVEIVTQPRPVQRELPVWVTVAGNPETFRDAARHGANVLTHLLGQSIAEVADKIQIYRATLVECGRNPADYKVTLMLHTLIGRDREAVREAAREPMKAYLKSATALIKDYAWAFPTFKVPQGVSKPQEVDLKTLEPDELDAIVEFAFLRYFDDSGLFGTVDDALARVAQVKAIGVDEIACLIDFGVPTNQVLASLEPLAEVVAAVNTVVAEAVAEEDGSIGGLIVRHGVTHLQCTPSMAAMVLSSEEDRAALAHLRHLFLGGEALKGALLAEIATITKANVFNMYGPTETTIWSASGAAAPTEGVVPLGLPISNTQLYILDEALRPQPVGLPGELYIGGDGVTRGYLNREDLTQERFLPDPFFPGGRMYRTGDLVRRGSSGELDFLGRADFQVKVRGYRIELGDIEACLRNHPGIGEAVVVAREDIPGDIRIVAYLRHSGDRVAEDALRTQVRAALPDYMMPAHFVALETFPLTPNAKIDRNALPRPDAAQVAVAKVVEFIAPTDEVEVRIADAFKRALNIEKIGALDNFFTLGGHSLLAVQVHRDLKKSVAVNLSITDIYRFPTVGGLAAHILDSGRATRELDRVANRAAQRRGAMLARRN